MFRAVVVVALIAIGGTAAAQGLGGLEIGARVGGYGFREHTADGTEWHDCRMNGGGIFAQRPLRGPFFTEAGIDAYFADDTGGFGHDHSAGIDTGMDRVSGLFTAAAGARAFAGARVSPYALLGLGLELTRVTMAGEEAGFALPMAFFGFGADLRFGRVSVGASFRINAMGHFAHDGPSHMEPEGELAAQGQFHIKASL